MIRGKFTHKRCPQCWIPKEIKAFRNAAGKVCRKRYSNWGKKTPEERQRGRVVRRGLRKQGEIRVLFTGRSGNKKLGGIPASMSSAETCPTSCTFYGNGCYGEYNHVRAHWSRVPQRGLKWDQFLEAVRQLPEGQLWRHNIVGDLRSDFPGIGGATGDFADGDQNGNALYYWLWQLVQANRGRRGFTFTHKHPLPVGWRDDEAFFDDYKGWVAAYRVANGSGFTVNMSADSLEEADELYDLHVAPIAVVIPSDAPSKGIRTPAGRHVVVCPAETHNLTCAECQLCANATRKSIVGFRAHGQWKQHVSQLVQLRKKPDAA